MSTNTTENLNLHSWAKTDPVKLEEFNENWAAIDDAAGSTWAQLAAVAAATPKIVYGSYIGTGVAGRNDPNTLTLDFAPKLVLLFWLNAVAKSFSNPLVLLRDYTTTFCMMSSSNYTNNVYYEGNTVRWHQQTYTHEAPSPTGSDAVEGQLNKNNTTYYYIAIG